MIRQFIFSLVIGIALALSACQKKQESTLENMLQTRKLQVTFVPSPPFCIKNPITGAYTGYMPELVDSLVALVEAEFGVEIEIVVEEATFGTTPSTLTSGLSKVATVELYNTEERAKVVDFLKPLFYMGFGVVVRKDDARFHGVRNISEFNRSDLKGFVATGEAGHSWAEKNLPLASIVNIMVDASDITRFALGVLPKYRDADFALAGKDVIDLIVNAHSEVVNPFEQNPFGLTAVSWAVRKGDNEWRDVLQIRLDILAARGVMHQLESKHGINVIHK